MQITQFIVGASYAALHPFVSYTIPVRVPSVVGAVSAVQSVAESPTFAILLKKFLFRAAGEEGLAENVNSQQAAHISSPKSMGETQEYHTQYQTVSCIDTSGQSFAIWLNVLYLVPLMFLFIRFFVKTYIIPNRSMNKRITAAKAGKDAIKGVERKLRENTTANGKANGKINGHSNGIMQMGE
jgi:GNS1/SUR4 family